MDRIYCMFHRCLPSVSKYTQASCAPTQESLCEYVLILQWPETTVYWKFKIQRHTILNNQMPLL